MHGDGLKAFQAWNEQLFTHEATLYVYVCVHLLFKELYLN